MAKIVTQLIDPRSSINDPLGLFGGAKSAAAATPAQPAPTSAAAADADAARREEELRRRRSMSTALTSGMDQTLNIERPALRPTLG